MCTACLPEKKENKIRNPADRQTDGQNGQLDEVLRLIECLRSATSCKILHSLAKQTYIYVYLGKRCIVSDEEVYIIYMDGTDFEILGLRYF